MRFYFVACNFTFVDLVFDPKKQITSPYAKRGTNVDYRILAISASSKLIASAEKMWQQRLKPIWYHKYEKELIDQ